MTNTCTCRFDALTVLKMIRIISALGPKALSPIGAALNPPFDPQRTALSTMAENLQSLKNLAQATADNEERKGYADSSIVQGYETQDIPAIIKACESMFILFAEDKYFADLFPHLTGREGKAAASPAGPSSAAASLASIPYKKKPPIPPAAAPKPAAAGNYRQQQSSSQVGTVFLIVIKRSLIMFYYCLIMFLEQGNSVVATIPTSILLSSRSASSSSSAMWSKVIEASNLPSSIQSSAFFQPSSSEMLEPIPQKLVNTCVNKNQLFVFSIPVQEAARMLNMSSSSSAELVKGQYSLKWMQQHCFFFGTSLSGTAAAPFYYMRVSTVTGNLADNGVYRVMHPANATHTTSSTPYLFCSIGLDASSTNIQFRAFVIVASAAHNAQNGRSRAGGREWDPNYSKVVMAAAASYF